LWPPGPGEEETPAAARGKEGIMENKVAMERLRRAALLALALAGYGVSHAAGIAIFTERVINPAPGFPGCSAGVCVEGPNPLAPETVQFNQQWSTAGGTFFMDGEAQTTGSSLTGAPTASARMRTNISGGADASIFYQVQLTCAPGVNCLIDAGSLAVPIRVVGHGSVEVRPDPTADNGAYLQGNVFLDISVSGISVLSGSVVAVCLYLGGVCNTGSVPLSFTVETMMSLIPLQTTSVNMYALANVLPPLNSPGRGGGEVIAMVDPIFYIDPEFRINGVLATDLLQLEFSPNLEAVPLPTTALLFPTALAAALGWRRRRNH
jgi:hypothetical protein